MSSAIGYIRVSTEEQARGGVSLAAQAHKIQTYAELHELDLVEIIRDEGFSGKNTNRPGLKQLLDLIDTSAADTVIVCKLDRLSRSTIDTLTLIEAFRSDDIAFHSIQEKVDTNSAMGQFFLTITAAFAQMERDLIAERTSFALQHKRRNGQKTGGRVPYGYKPSTQNGTIHLVEDPDEQKTIRSMGRYRAQGKSYRAIARRLNERGILTRSAKDNTDHHQALWTHKSVAKILRAGQGSSQCV